jgi:hypothetical protein
MKGKRVCQPTPQSIMVHVYMGRYGATYKQVVKIGVERLEAMTEDGRKIMLNGPWRIGPTKRKGVLR